MHPTRRDVNSGLAAAVLAAIAGRGLAAGAPTGAAAPDDVFLNRLSFGVTPETRAALARLGRAGWLEEQLAPAGDAGLEARLADMRLWIEYEAEETEAGAIPATAEYRALEWLDAPPVWLVALLDEDRPLSWAERERPGAETRAVALMRAVHGQAQLNELMTQFWHDHFNVDATRDEITGALFPTYDRGLRARALGRFRALLGHVAKAPVMLRYLDNDNSYASPANENFARELLELHTLGQDNYLNDRYENWRDVPGAAAGLAEGYIDDDVYEVARAFTGWSIGDGREIGENQVTPLTGEIAYVEAWHDPYQKRVLGVELPDHAAPMADGERVLDLLAAHPGTARFVSRKMLRRLGIETPSDAYAAHVAQVFHANRDAPDQIARVIRAIVAHPEFDATPPAKLRRPFEFLAALFRTTGAQVAPRRDGIDWMLRQAGWAQHAVAPPTGHSDVSADWANTRTVLGLLTLAVEAHGDWLELTDTPLARVPGEVANMGALAAHWAGRFGIDPAALAAAVAGQGFDPDDALPDEADWFSRVNTILVASAAMDARFLYR